MSKKRNPNGMGSYGKTSDGRSRWRQTVDGKTREVSAKTDKMLQEKVNLISDMPIVKEKYTVDKWFKKWLNLYVEPLKKANTYSQYKNIYYTHIEPVMGYKMLFKVKPDDIQSVITSMNKNNKSTWTMKHARKVMNLAFKKAEKNKFVSENPVRDIEIPSKQSKPRKTLNTEELKVLFDCLKTTRWYWATRFMLVTGLRRGELLALKWSDIDYEKRRIVIDESNTNEGIGDTKSAKVHYVPLSDKAILYLNNQKDLLVSEVNPILHNIKLKELDLIFPSEKGTLMKPDSFNSVFDRINKKAGIHVTPHMLRHTFVYMSKGLMTLTELQEALGHDESTTTLDIYGTMLSDTGKVANKIDEAFTVLDGELNKIVKKKNKGKIVQFPNAR